MPRVPRRQPAKGPTGPKTNPTAGRWSLGAVRPAVEARLAAWAAADAAGRIWRKDPGFWPSAPAADIGGRLGWLRTPEQSASRTAEWREFAAGVRRDGFSHVVLLGMGGSSLAADVIAQVLPPVRGWPKFSVLDSTHPAAVQACLDRAPVDRTLYLVSSKSGTTLEPNAFLRFFWEQAGRAPGEPRQRFVAITDPGTALERLAADRRFRTVFSAPPDIGGRYSALSVFGMVPAALMGVDLDGLLGSARAMVARCAAPGEAALHPGLALGATLGELALAGRNKVVFPTSASLRAFPAWVEQLVAESLGKLGRGVVPVANAPPPGEFPHGSDVVYVYVALEGERERAVERELAAQEADGAPVLRFTLGSPLELGREFFRWEFAIAACGAVLDVDPFDQPDVEHAKDLARAEMGRSTAPASRPDRYGSPPDDRLEPELANWLGSARPGDYVAVQAFLAPSEGTDEALGRLLSRLRQALGIVVTLGYGPRFLHSTGQMHKGGPPSGLFLQIVDEPAADLPVPGLGLTFAEMLRAEASGDRAALEEKRRRILVANVGTRPLDGLDALTKLVGRHAPDGRPPS